MSASPKHPAVEAVRQLRDNRYPKKALWPEIIQKVGDDFDLDRLKACYLEWLSRGYNSESVKWATEWYASNEIPTQGAKSNGKSKYKSQEQNYTESGEWIFGPGTPIGH